MGGAGEKNEIDERVEVISSAMEHTTSEYDREKL